MIRTLTNEFLLGSGTRVVEDHAAEGLPLAFVDRECVAAGERFNLALSELGEANIDRLVIGEIGIHVNDGSIAFGSRRDARVSCADDGEGHNVLGTAPSASDVVAGDCREESFQHGRAGPKAGEVNMLDLLWVTDQKRLVVLGDEIDVSDREGEGFFYDDKGPLLFLQLAEAGMNGGSERGGLEFFLVLISESAGRAEDEDGAGWNDGWNYTIDDGRGLGPTGDTGEREHVLEVESFWVPGDKLVMGGFEDSFEGFCFRLLGTLKALLDECLVLFFRQVSGLEFGVNVDGKVEHKGPFWRDAALRVIWFGEVGLSREDLVLRGFDFRECFDVIIEEDFLVVTALLEGIVAVVVLEEGECAAMEEVGRGLGGFLVRGVMMEYPERMADPTIDLAKK